MNTRNRRELTLDPDARWATSSLWPESRVSPDGWKADRKDGLERLLKRLVCDERLPLALAQRAIALDLTQHIVISCIHTDCGW